MNYKAKLHGIKAFVFDYDGVISDGNIWSANDQIIVRSGNVKDGYAIQYAVKQNLLIFVITGAKSLGVQQRFANLGVQEIHLGIADKLTLLKSLLTKYKMDFHDVLFVGDDMPDYFCMQQVAVAVAPADAIDDIKHISHYVSTKKGGEGVVREILEKMLKLQEKWHHDVFVKSV